MEDWIRLNGLVPVRLIVQGSQLFVDPSRAQLDQLFHGLSVEAVDIFRCGGDDPDVPFRLLEPDDLFSQILYQICAVLLKEILERSHPSVSDE